MFEEIERVQEKRVTQDIITQKERKSVSTTVLKARRILDNLERIKTAIQNKEPVPEYIPVTAKDIAMLDRDTEITTSEIENAQRITEEIKNQFKGKENEQK